MTSIDVALGARAYQVRVGSGLLREAGGMIRALGGPARLAVVTDETVARLHLPVLQASLAEAGLSYGVLVLPPGEQTKSFAGLARVSDWLAEGAFGRGDMVAAFGGGVIGDLAGLAAGLFKRGMAFVQIPTTLLAQVDSSVGGKTAIDIPAGKNLVGLFHQPRLVIADLDVLASLPARELRAGYAEVVKYALIDQPEFFEWLDAHGADTLGLRPDALAHAVVASIRAKARIVAADEQETAGARALLNLGHTFAHGLEAVAGYDGALVHGEAVAVGLRLAFDYSARLGLCARGEAHRVRLLLEAAGFELCLRRLTGGPFPPDAVVAAMANDKKADAAGLTLILARGVGRAFVSPGHAPGDLRAFLNDDTTKD